MKIKFEAGSSAVHKFNPLTKLLVLLVYSIAIFTFDGLEVELLCFLALLAIMLFIRSKAAMSLITSKYFISFAVLLVAIQVLFSAGGDLIFRFPLGPLNVDITTMGILVGLIVAFRFMTIIMASGIFVATTDPNELAYALMKAGLPYRFGFMLVTAIRFVPVFESEAGTVRSAQIARGLDIDKGGISGVIKAARYTLMPLVVSALSKVDVLVISMEGRAFGIQRTRTFTRSVRFTTLDAIVIIATIALTALLIAIVWLGLFTLPNLHIYNR